MTKGKGEIVLVVLQSLGFSEGFLRMLINKTGGDFWTFWDNALIGDLLMIYPRLSARCVEVWRSFHLSDGKLKRDDIVSRVYSELSTKSIQFAIRGGSTYPPLLVECDKAPPILYWKGNIEPLLEHGRAGADPEPKCLAVVGSRRMTSYGKFCVDKLMGEMAGAGLGIVSGLALGVDGYVHEKALENGEYCVGVLGCGLDYVYPPSNKHLYEGIVRKGGVLISPFYPDTRPDKTTFPRRNHVIAGLSHGVLIVEAAQKSGTLITALAALDYGRDVFVVPGDINRAMSCGTDSLWKQGASPVVCGEDVLMGLGIEQSEQSNGQVIRHKLKLNPDSLAVMNILSEGLTTDAICYSLSWDIGRVQVALTLLEIDGLIVKTGPVWSKIKNP